MCLFFCFFKTNQLVLHFLRGLILDCTCLRLFVLLRWHKSHLWLARHFRTHQKHLNLRSLIQIQSFLRHCRGFASLWVFSFITVSALTPVGWSGFDAREAACVTWSVNKMVLTCEASFLSQSGTFVLMMHVLGSVDKQLMYEWWPIFLQSIC